MSSKLDKKTFGVIFREERGVAVLMVVNLILAVVLIMMTFFHMNPNSTVTTIGYGDIGGYRDGAWTNILEFLVVGALFGFLHNLLAVRIFEKRGAGMTKFFLILTTMLILGAFVVFLRVFGG